MIEPARRRERNFSSNCERFCNCSDPLAILQPRSDSLVPTSSSFFRPCDAKFIDRLRKSPCEGGEPIELYLSGPDPW